MDVSKLIKKSSGFEKKNSTIKEENDIYTKVNETAFNLLNNITASDDKCDQFNSSKNLERIRTRVYNRELSLCHPMQREYDLIMNKIANNKLYKMEGITEESEEETKSIGESFDKCEDAFVPYNKDNIKISIDNTVSMVETLNISPPATDKSTELPQRRTFFDMFHSTSPKLSKSYDVDTSFADQKTRVTTTSPSQFSARRTSDSKSIFKTHRLTMTSDTKKRAFLKN